MIQHILVGDTYIDSLQPLGTEIMVDRINDCRGGVH